MNKEQQHLESEFKKCNPSVYFDEEKGIYRKSYRGRRWKGLKKLSNKKLRKSKSEKPSKKEFDIDWIYF